MEKLRPDPKDFDLIDKSDDQLVKRYQPRFLGMGGDQVVYELEGHPNVVAKVGYELLRDSIEDNLENGRPGDDLGPEYQQYFEQIKANRQVINELFAEYFGREHLVPEKMFLMRVPLTPDLLKGIFKGQVPEGAQGLTSAWTRVVIQEKVPELQRERFTLSPDGRLENKTTASDVYERGVDLLLKGKAGELTEETFLKLMGSTQEEKSLPRIFEQMRQSPELRALIVDFVARSVRFINETGRTFDISGKDNIIFFKGEDGHWNYKFIDALLSARRPLAMARDTLRQLVAGKPMTEDKSALWALHKMINIARLMNGLAILFGLPDRIEIFDERDKDKEVDLLSLLRAHPKP